MQMVKCYPSEIIIFLWMETLSSRFLDTKTEIDNREMFGMSTGNYGKMRSLK